MLGGCLNLFKALVGLGVLNLPVAFRNSGYIGGLILLPISALGIIFLSALLVKAADDEKHYSRTMADFIKYAVGPIFSIILNVSLFFSQLGSCISYCIFSIKFVQETLCYAGESEFVCVNKTVSTLIITAVLLPLILLRDISKLKYTSMAGNIVIFFALLTSLIFCFIRFDNYGVKNVEPVSAKIGESIGTFIFAF